MNGGKNQNFKLIILENIINIKCNNIFENFIDIYYNINPNLIIFNNINKKFKTINKNPFNGIKMPY